MLQILKLRSQAIEMKRQLVLSNKTLRDFKKLSKDFSKIVTTFKSLTAKASTAVEQSSPDDSDNAVKTFVIPSKNWMN
jgi:hypothetical protein